MKTVLRSAMLVGLLSVSLTQPSFADSADLSVRIGDVSIGFSTNRPPPPPAIIEVIPERRYGHFWVPGHWEWEGRRHVWVQGTWERERPGYRHVESRWERHGDRWHYVPAKWERSYSEHHRDHANRSDGDWHGEHRYEHGHLPRS